MSQSSKESSESGFNTRNITLHLDGCLEHETSILLEKMYAAWKAATYLANALVLELIVADALSFPWKTGTWNPEKPDLPHLFDILGGPVESIAYRMTGPKGGKGLETFSDQLPSQTVSKISRNIVTHYQRVRRGAIIHLNDQYPLFRFPLPLPVHNSDIELAKDPKDSARYTIKFPILRAGKGIIERVTMRIAPGKKDANTVVVNDDLPLVEKLLRGIYTFGDMLVCADRRRVSAKEAKKKSLPFHKDKFGYRYVYEPYILLPVHFPVGRMEKGRHGLVLIHTDQKTFLSARVHRHSKWDMTMKHVQRSCHMPECVLTPHEMRQMIEAHDARNKAIQQDTKAGFRGSRNRSETDCEKHARRLAHFLNVVVKCQLENVQRHQFAKVYYFDGDRTFMPHFPYSAMASKLANAFAENGFEFEHLDKFNFTDCENDGGGWNHDKIYFKIRGHKSAQTKRSQKARQREREGRALEAGLVGAHHGNGTTGTAN